MTPTAPSYHTYIVVSAYRDGFSMVLEYVIEDQNFEFTPVPSIQLMFDGIVVDAYGEWSKYHGTWCSKTRQAWWIVNNPACNIHPKISNGGGWKSHLAKRFALLQTPTQPWYQWGQEETATEIPNVASEILTPPRKLLTWHTHR